MNQYEVLHSPFDIETHKATFVDYLEVVILPNGTVEYAVPSHQKKMEGLAADKMGISVDDVPWVCPQERWGDYDVWLREQTGAIAVWGEAYSGKPNAIQRRRLLQLKVAGLYIGKI